ncbi:MULTISPECIES: acyltransferase [unclassified Mucilaginibacter]|uniref:acyltransferase family protein n=1 Tax=unclassified Mucilaginibacter TaxID=2617802 RepID=UPI002AC936D2|nr:MULTISPECIES: acyltransferase [unclassified Mucilaginibacter]MEB0280619.1 acyltransferase [Mucilaginibacter sp. 10B2]MEB0300292.1 acyltransferase [Mucilaginibacter sp. 5C4]WPX24963.1 acyltransferase [Mucilaginibacter sp. 5C4]
MIINERLESIVTLRAIAALLVCLIHLAMISGFHTTGILQALINEGQSGVAIFFVISGFILPYSLYKKVYLIKDFFSFLTGRIIRIDPPYWASIILVFLIGLQPLIALNAKSVLLHLTYLVPFISDAHWYSDVYWTLSIEFQYYILIGLAYPFLMRLKPLYALSAVIIPSVICILLKANFRGIIITNLYDFTIGFIVFLGFTKRLNLKITLAALFVFSFYVMQSVSIKSGAVPIIAALFLLFYKPEFSLKPVLFIGNISYSLYLIHVPISILVVRIAQKHIASSGYLLFITFSGSILASYIFYLLIEKPSIKFSRLFRSNPLKSQLK